MNTKRILFKIYYYYLVFINFNYKINVFTKKFYLLV